MVYGATLKKLSIHRESWTQSSQVVWTYRPVLVATPYNKYCTLLVSRGKQPSKDSENKSLNEL